MADAFNVAISGANAGWSGFTLVLAFQASALADVSGSQVRLTVEFDSADPPNNTSKAAVYMGKAAGSGDVYDFAATPVHVTFGGGGDIQGDGSTFTFVSDTINLPEAFDGTVNYCVAIEFTTTLIGNHSLQFASATGVRGWYTSGATAATVNKAAGYTDAGDGTTYFVSRIEILGATAHVGEARFAGVGSQRADTIRGLVARANFAGAGALSIAAQQSFNASVSLAGAGGLSSFANLQNRAAAQFPGIGALSARANMPQPAFATLSGFGTLSVQPQLGQLIETRFEGLSDLSVEGILTQYLRPDADDLDGSWTNELDGTNLFPSIDEAIVPDDADYIKSGNHPVADICRFGISNPTRTPAGPMRLRVRYRREGTGVVNLVVRLKQDTTEIAAWTYNDIGASFVTAEETLTGPQFAAITNFNNLFVELQADEA